MEYINCNLCNSNEYKLFKEINGYQLVKCRQCGLVYLNPRLTQQEMKLGDGIRADHSKSITEQFTKSKDHSVYLGKIHAVIYVICCKLLGLRGHDLTIYARR